MILNHYDHIDFKGIQQKMEVRVNHFRLASWCVQAYRPVHYLKNIVGMS